MKRRQFNNAIDIRFKPNHIQDSLPAPMDRRMEDEPRKVKPKPWWGVEIRRPQRFLKLRQWIVGMPRGTDFPGVYPGYLPPPPVHFGCRCFIGVIDR